MADLSYGDVQHAAQDAVRSMQSEVQRISSTVSSISQQTHQIGDALQMIRDVQHSLQNLQSASGGGNFEVRMSSLQNDMQDLKMRVSTIEEIMRPLSEYAQIMLERERENKEYRGS